jgi:hypothetical protein
MEVLLLPGTGKTEARIKRPSARQTAGHIYRYEIQRSINNHKEEPCTLCIAS